MKANAEQILEIIKALNISPRGTTTFSPDISFKDQGVDSLDQMSLFLNIEEKFGIKIPDADIDGLSSITKIIDYLNRK